MRFINRKTTRTIQERVAKRECLRLTLALIFAIFYTNRNNFTLLSNITFTLEGYLMVMLRARVIKSLSHFFLSLK